MSATGSGILLRKRRRIVVTAPWRADVVESLHPSAYFRRKAILDRTLAILLLLPGLPLIGILVLLVRLTSRGPGIYHQVRLGQHGRRFQIYKIRTMRHEAEAASGPVWTTQARDPRVTLVGKVLRRLHLDELPQLLNILTGELSLVGPRPERPEFVHVLTEAIPGYWSRLGVPPGVTGLAQLNLPPDSDLNSVRCKLVLDREYMEQAGLLLDLRILASTFFRMFRVPERWLLSMLGLRRRVTLAEVPEGTSANGVDGAGHVAASPTSIWAEAVRASIKDNGGPQSDGNRPGTHHHGGNGHSKPR
jgi:lipopolysaccharide/colanic/teichoic acid biosynthesis glycosyltransferase